MKDLKILVTYSNTPNCCESVSEHNGMNEAFNKDIYVPVLGGAELYKGKNEFFNSILHDNTGENISTINPNVNEFSVLYWAYHNYEKIGSPEYIGHCHYRRMISIKSDDDLNENTIFVNQYQNSVPLGTQFLLTHTPNVVNTFSQFSYSFMKNNPDDLNLYVSWLSQSVLFGYNMFIMHKDMFFKYMKEMIKYFGLLCPYIFTIATIPDRGPAFVIERITSYVISKMSIEDTSIVLKQGIYTKLDECEI